MPLKDTENPLSFEKSIERLEEIIRLTDASSTELEEVISLVEEGSRLIRHCKSILKKAELRIEVLENAETTEKETDPTINPPEPYDRTNGTESFSLN